MNKNDLLASAITLTKLDTKAKYFIVNHGYGAYLKLQYALDSGDRLAWAHEGDRQGQDSRYTWTVTPIGDEKYSFQNFSETGGFLFRGNGQFDDRDYGIWGHNGISIDGSKDGRYKFKIVPVGDTGVLFNIVTDTGAIVKAGTAIDEGDHGVFAQPPMSGDNTGEDRFQWFFVPVS